MEKEKAQKQEIIYRVFINDQGKFYKAEKAENSSHAEVTFPTGDMLKALEEKPISREEMIAKINHPDFHKTQAVLADG